MTAIILVIDDSEDDQRLYQRAFKDFDCMLEMVSTAEAGFARIVATDLPRHAKSPDLILLDYNLPEMDGLSFMQQLAGHAGISIPIVMLTGEGSTEVAVEAMKRGADEYLIKDTEGRYLRLLPSVAARVMAARAQHEQAARLLRRNQALMQNAMDGIHVMDMQGSIVEANDAFCSMLGYTQEEMARLNVADWDAQWSAEELRERFEWLIGKSTRFETVHRRKDGTLIDVEVSTSGMEIDGQSFLYAASRDITERKQAEATLMQHKLVLDTSIDGFWMVDMQGNLLEANEAYAEMSGYTAAELVNMHISQLEATEQSPEIVRAHIEKIITQGYDRFETRHRHKDGHEIDIEISVAYMAGPQRLVVFCRDISARKQVEDALLKSEANLRAMLDNSPYLTWLKDTDGRYITINKVFADYLKLEDVREAVGKNDLDLQPKELAEKYRADDAGVMASRKQKHIEEASFDGKNIHWVETFKTPIVDAQDEVLGTVGFARDITERKRMQLQTEALLRRNQALMKTSMDGIHVLDMQGNVVDANDAFCRMLGYTREEAVGLNVTDWDALWSIEELRERFRELIGKSALVETVHRRKDGVLLDVEISVTGEEIDGRVLLFCSSRDITERKRTERELLLESEAEHRRAEVLAQQFGHLLQSSVNEIYLFDADSLRFLETSEGAEKNLGYSAGELEGLTPLDLLPEYTRESFESLVAPLRRGEQQFLLFDTCYRRKDDSTYPVEARLQLMQGESHVFLAIVQDISERKAADETLRFHSNILKSMTEGIHLVRASDGVIVFANPQFEHMFGYASGELLGKHVSILNAPGEYSPDAVAAAINDELDREGAWSGEVRNIRKDGTTFWCQANVSTFEHSQFGTVWVAVHEDITKRKQSELQARELSAHLQTVREEEKASFAREIHDDLGGTLAALKMDAHWLAGRLATQEEMRPLWECTKSMVGLLDTAVLATRRIITDLRPTILDDLGLLEALKWQAAQFHTRTGIECQVACSGDDCNEEALGGILPINLFRIFQEALTNIARHSAASRVEVSLRLDDEDVILSISDNGCGLPDEYSIASTSYGLRGMRERATLMGGEIRLGRPPGGGLCVTVSLPQPAGRD